MNGFKLKNKFLLVFLLCLQVFPLSSKPKASFGINSGITFGKLGEYIYSSKLDDATIVSYLEWEQKPTFLIGTSFILQFTNFLLDNNAFFYIPSNCGNMYDSDWNKDGLFTTYSISENSLKFAFKDTFTFLYNFNLKNYFSISPLLQIDYSFIKFMARNGIMWDGSNTNVSYDNKNAIYYEKGRVNGADYYKHSLDFYLGSKIEYFINKKISIDFSFLFTPFSYALVKDTHLTNKNTEIKFIDYHKQTGFLNKYKLCLNLQYNIKENQKIYINNCFAISTKLFGTLLTNRINDKFYYVGQKTASDECIYTLMIGYLWEM